MPQPNKKKTDLKVKPQYASFGMIKAVADKFKAVGTTPTKPKRK